MEIMTLADEFSSLQNVMYVPQRFTLLYQAPLFEKEGLGEIF
jgi:hypothetical protein